MKHVPVSRLPLCAILAAAGFLSACGSITSAQRARTLPRGTVELAGDVGLMVPRVVRIPPGSGPFIDIDQQYPTLAPFFGLPWGFLEFGAAYGFTDRLEGRVRASVVGLEVGGKVEVLDLDPVPIVVSVAPAARARLGAPTPAVDLIAPLLIGIPFGEGQVHELVFSSRYMPTLSQRGVVHGVGGGLSVALASGERGTWLIETGVIVTRTGTAIPGATVAEASLGVGYALKL